MRTLHAPYVFCSYGLTAGELHNADSWLDRFWPPSAELMPTTDGMREPLPDLTDLSAAARLWTRPPSIRPTRARLS
jgi:hypothetical protein